jgi:hypothetical protein
VSLDWTPAVLRNRGTPVEVWSLDQAGRVSRDENDEPIVTRRQVRFDANGVATLEERFGAQDEFYAAVLAKPFTAVRAALAAAWDEDERRVGTMMIPDRIQDYVAAVMGAFSMAIGVDPQLAAKLAANLARAIEAQRTAWRSAVEAVVADVEAQVETLEREAALIGSTGSASSERGSDAGTTSGPSGD